MNTKPAESLQARKNIKAIQGLRGVSVFLVILAHSEFPFTRNGFVGVDIFFVLSGFLITRKMVDEYLSNRAASKRQGWISFTSFYLRRIRKIVPSAFFVIFIVFVVSLVYPQTSGTKVSVETDAAWALFFLANLNYMSQSIAYFGVPLSKSPLLHYWSLSVEEQFYMVWPLIFLSATSARGFKFIKINFNWRNRVRLFLLLIVILSLIIYLGQLISGDSAGYFSTLGRLWEFGSGALFALNKNKFKLVHSKVFQILCLSSCIVSFLFFSENNFRYFVVVIVLFTGMLILEIFENETFPRFALILENRFLLFLGKISFPLYLIHFPVIVFLENKGIKTGNFNFLVIFPGMLILASFVYKEIESRFMRISIPEVSKKSAARRTRYYPLNKDALRYSCALTMIVIILLNIQKTNGVPFFTSVFKAKVVQPWSPPYLSDGEVSAETSTTKVGLLPQPKISSSSSSLSLETQWQKILLASLKISNLPEGIQPNPSQLDSERIGVWDSCIIIVNDTPACNSGKENSRSTTYIFGDSYALAIAPMVKVALSLDDTKVLSRIHGQCLIPLVPPKSVNVRQECSEHRTSFYEEISRNRPYLIIGSSLNTDTFIGSKKDLYKGMLSEFTKLVQSADHVVIIGETPFMMDPRVCPGSKALLAGCFGSSLSRSYSRLLTEQAAKAAGADYIDITTWMCVNQKCPVIIDGTLTTYDGGHLTVGFSEKLAPLFRDKLKKLGLTFG